MRGKRAASSHRQGVGAERGGAGSKVIAELAHWFSDEGITLPDDLLGTLVERGFLPRGWLLIPPPYSTAITGRVGVSPS